MGGWEPVTLSGKLFLLIWCFYALVNVAALTAASAAVLSFGEWVPSAFSFLTQMICFCMYWELGTQPPAIEGGAGSYTFAHFVAGTKVLDQGACLLKGSAYSNFLKGHSKQVQIYRPR